MMALEMKGKLASIRQIRYKISPSPPPSKRKTNKQTKNKQIRTRYMDGWTNNIINTCYLPVGRFLL